MSKRRQQGELVWVKPGPTSNLGGTYGIIQPAPRVKWVDGDFSYETWYPCRPMNGDVFCRDVFCREWVRIIPVDGRTRTQAMRNHLAGFHLPGAYRMVSECRLASYSPMEKLETPLLSTSRYFPMAGAKTIGASTGERVNAP